MASPATRMDPKNAPAIKSLLSVRGDMKRGDTNGEGLNAYGAKWYVLAPSGNKIDRD